MVVGRSRTRIEPRVRASLKSDHTTQYPLSKLPFNFTDAVFFFCPPPPSHKRFPSCNSVKLMREVPALPENPIEIPLGGGGVAVSDGLKAEHGEEGDRNSAANRWPREETMALLNIRSEMDAAFRDASPKAPLWEQVSRKLAELGYQRSAKKCREKFENLYKYHRRTKEGRCGRSNGGKTYRFFEQLEALDSHPVPPPSSEGQQQQHHEVSAKSTTAPTAHVTPPEPDNNVNVIRDAVPCSIRFPSADVLEHWSSTTSSSGELGARRKKRKLTEFFEGLMREVMERQETLQRKLMEALDKCERDRMAREEAWKVQELARIQRERELLAQERSIAAAKDEAVLAFLKNITAGGTCTVQLPEIVQVPNENEKDKGTQENIANVNGDGGGEGEKQECGNVSVGNFIHVSSSRWPRDEVEALIRLRTEMDVQSQANGSKGPLWEEISLAMKNLGYDRSAKRCKEKWENINKYFKRMKEKNRRKPMDSKTCPYYHHLEALYSKKPGKHDESGGSGNELKPEELLMHIMGSQQERQQLESSSEDAERDNTMDQNQHGDNEEQGGYHMVANSPSIPIMG